MLAYHPPAEERAALLALWRASCGGHGGIQLRQQDAIMEGRLQPVQSYSSLGGGCPIYQVAHHLPLKASGPLMGVLWRGAVTPHMQPACGQSSCRRPDSTTPPSASSRTTWCCRHYSAACRR